MTFLGNLGWAVQQSKHIQTSELCLTPLQAPIYLTPYKFAVQSEHKAAIERLREREVRKISRSSSKKRKLKQIEYNSGETSILAIDSSRSKPKVDDTG
jgi:hypothetical protein